MIREILFGVTAYLVVAALSFVLVLVEDRFASYTADERTTLRVLAGVAWPILLAVYVASVVVALARAAAVLARGTRALAGRGLRRVRGRDRVGMPRARVMRGWSVTGVRS